MNDHKEWNIIDGYLATDGITTAFPSSVNGQDLPATYLCLVEGEVKALVIPKGELIYNCSPSLEACSMLHCIKDFFNTMSPEYLENMELETAAILVEQLLTSSEMLEEVDSSTSLSSIMKNILQEEMNEEEVKAALQFN